MVATIERAEDGVYHRVDKLDAVVLWRIVTGGDHNTNGLAIELARAQRGQESHTVNDRVENLAEDGELGYKAASERATYAFMRNWSNGQHCVGSTVVDQHLLTPAVPYWNLPTSSAGVGCLAEASLTAWSWLIAEMDEVFDG